MKGRIAVEYHSQAEMKAILNLLRSNGYDKTDTVTVCGAGACVKTALFVKKGREER